MKKCTDIVVHFHTLYLSLSQVHSIYVLGKGNWQNGTAIVRSDVSILDLIADH